MEAIFSFAKQNKQTNKKKEEEVFLYISYSEKKVGGWTFEVDSNWLQLVMKSQGPKTVLRLHKEKKWLKKGNKFSTLKKCVCDGVS